jgi:hypothetical protein
MAVALSIFVKEFSAIGFQGVIMKKAVLGIGAVLVAATAFANDPTKDQDKIAAVDADSASFAKLDADTDGRLSAIEASNSVRVAAAFTTADADKDGYLTKEEFSTVGEADQSSESQTESDESASDTETPPQQ